MQTNVLPQPHLRVVKWVS